MRSAEQPKADQALLGELVDEFAECGPIGHVDFVAGAVDVALHRSHRNGEGFGDLFVGQAIPDQGGDLTFTPAQGQRRGDVAGGRRS
jgi:hypothetical protein